MKKSLFLLSLLAVPFVGFAENPVFEWKTNQYVLKMSPNGQWLGSMAGNASLINAQTQEITYYDTGYLGLGNAVSDTGVAVGNSDGDIACVMLPGKNQIMPKELTDNYWFCDIQAITADGTRICGIVNNPDSKNETLYVPFVASINASGDVSNVEILPYPEKDFFDMAPQFVTAVWISDDAQTVAGQVSDWRGMYTYPIVYKIEGASWKYYLPSEDLFNPTNISIPTSPWVDEPPYPEPSNYMTGAKKQAYLEAFENYSVNGGIEPDPKDYTTPEQYKELEKAVAVYNVWYYAHETEFKAYQAIYREVLKTSPTFSDNDLALSPDGKIAMYHGGLTEYDSVGDASIVGKVYSFSTENIGEYEIYNTETGEYLPQQVFNDGTWLATKGQMDLPNAYIYPQGSKEWVSIPDYLADLGYPELAEQLVELAPNATGVVNISADGQLITGALMPDALPDYDSELSNFYYSTYYIIFGEAGIESLVTDPENGVYKVYDLKGIKVLETKEASEVNALPHGIYIVNGKKVVF